MEKREYKNIYDHEDGHFFYVSTHNLVLRLAAKYLGPKKEVMILDAGCGTGGLMTKLAGMGTVVGVDYNQEALKYARKRGVRVIKAGIEKLPFKNGVFDLVTSIDVIYHRKIKNDVAVLAEMRRVLKPNGVLILRVPANKDLWSAHDRYVHTARRYTKEELRQKLIKAGFRLRFLSLVNSLFFPISLLRVRLERLRHEPSSSAVTDVNPLINRVLIGLLNLETELICRGLALPFGQGLVAVAIK